LWLLRIDDLDTPRNRAGSVTAILKCLEAFGLHWDGSVYYQSHHLESYEYFLNELEQNRHTYRCDCSRKMLAEQYLENSPDSGHNIYPGVCRGKAIPSNIPHAIRIITGDTALSFQDELQGLISHNLARRHGDFILKRKDRIIAYPFAVVVDDALQLINHVVRGCDLLEETPKQIFLQQTLALPTPAYMHVPVIVDRYGYKLSKQTLATAVDTKMPSLTLFDVLVLLKQNPPDELNGASIKELLDWAIINWHADALHVCRAIML
jgi:glutamyl-Q tRNA(Asp) synthetase